MLREDGVEIKPAKPGDKVPFKDLRVTPWYQLTDKALATLRTGKVPASVVDKLAAWREQFGLEISDRTLSALQEAKAPDAVMDKIKSLKDKAFDRPTLVSLLDRLSPAERDKFQDTVLQHASKEPKFEHDQLVAELDKLLSPEEKAKYEDTLLKQTSLGDMIAVSFPDVRQDINFTLVFFDQYGVKGSRAIQIKAKEDQPPELNEVMPDVVRKTKDGYIVSVLARVPFRGRVKDDAGLSGLRYAYTLSKIESGPRINVRALFMYAAVPGPGGHALQPRPDGGLLHQRPVRGAPAPGYGNGRGHGTPAQLAALPPGGQRQGPRAARQAAASSCRRTRSRSCWPGSRSCPSASC